MRVLVIRPEVQAARTAGKLEALGHEADILPLLVPVHDLASAAEALKSSYSALAVTSAEAIRCLQRLGPVLEPYLDVPVFTVGKATAWAAKHAGFTNIHAAGGNGRELAGLVTDCFAASDNPTKPLLYLAAATRSGLFESTLADNGIDCVTTEIYHMAVIAFALEQQQALLVNKPVDAVFFFSKENAKAFFDLEVFRTSKDALRKTLFFCLSRNIAEAIPDEFSNSAVISLNPDEDELIDLL